MGSRERPGIFAPDFAEVPFWWDAAPRPRRPPEPVPARADVAVVGSGHTGLVAALTLARGGRGVVVLEAGVPGHGASSRNAGFVGRTLKHDFPAIAAHRGRAFAEAVYREVFAAYDFLRDLVAGEGLACHYVRGGRFLAALSARHYEHMARSLEERRKALGEPFAMIPRAEQHREIGSDAYHGGAVTEERASIHPGLYQLGLLERALAAGVRILSGTEVTGVQADGAGFAVATARGRMAARDVLVATNGYTGWATPWLRRRLVPFHGFMVATEPLPPSVVDRVLPRPRIVQDYNVNIFFVRRSPDGRRILFGGYTGGPARDLRAKAARLHAAMARLFPDLAGARLSHAWSGQCAATLDHLPHIGVRDGMHHALGYSFTGVPMGTWLGRKAALQILGDRDGATAFDGEPFPAAPFFTRHRWFVPMAMAYYDWQDRRGL